MTTTSGATTLDLVAEYHRAWTSGDVDRAMTYLADEFVCRAPGKELEGKEAYRGYLSGFVTTLTGLTDIASFADGDRVALFYHPHTAATSTAPAAECFTVRDGLIVQSVLLFDRLSFAPPNEQ